MSEPSSQVSLEDAQKAIELVRSVQVVLRGLAQSGNYNEDRSAAYKLLADTLKRAVEDLDDALGL